MEGRDRGAVLADMFFDGRELNGALEEYDFNQLTKEDLEGVLGDVMGRWDSGSRIVALRAVKAYHRLTTPPMRVDG